jgi:hypothetical protein
MIEVTIGTTYNKLSCEMGARIRQLNRSGFLYGSLGDELSVLALLARSVRVVRNAGA